MADFAPLIAAALSWLAANSDLPPPPPSETLEVVQVPFLQLQIRYFGVEQVTSQLMRGHGLNPIVWALYDEGFVAVAAEADPTDFKMQTIILHETVHWLEDLAGVDFECRGAAERAAYDLQIKWLKANDVPEDSELYPDPFWLLMSTSCHFTDDRYPPR